MRIAIVEDEDLVAEELKNMLTQLDRPITILAHLDSVASAVAWLKENTVDLLFLDVNLGDGNSFSIFEQVDINTPVIFTTAYDEYAIQAFEYNSIAFLLKPIDEEDLIKAFEKVESMKTALQTAPLKPRTDNAPKKYKKRFLATGVKKMTSIAEQDVAYFRAEGKYLYLIEKSGKSHLIESTLKELEEQLDPVFFFRINRKMFITYDAIEGVVSFSKNRKKVLLSPTPNDPLESIVSAERNKAFLSWLDH